MVNYKELLADINTFIFDYDGVFTNGTVILMNTGEPLRTANVKDGYALQLAVKKGYRIVIISGGRSESVISRFKALNIKDVFLGVDNKIERYRNYLAEHNMESKNTLYMGDDIPDYEVMKEVGVATCPADAAEEIKSISHYISLFSGGEGCVRDVIEQVLKVQGKWMNDDAYQWEIT
ncbi:MAG: HAD-IIIA family hydrolase [Bacteroidetes bacterium]|nr:HAD-IIIA family hydrolase [Bacteroidota bacterium]